LTSSLIEFLNTTKKFVVFVSVILLAPLKVKVINPKDVDNVLISTLAEVARGTPVGVPAEPKVPVCE